MKEEVGQRSIFLLRQWEKLEKKMADYRNHPRFTIKCLKMRQYQSVSGLRPMLKHLRASRLLERLRENYSMNI